jgi:zinc protease
VAAADNYTIDSSKYKAPDYGYKELVYKKPKDNFDRSKMPAAGPGVNVNVPPFWRSQIANGIQVIGTRNDEIPTVTITISIPGGHLADGADKSKAGLSYFMAELMNDDTKNYTAEAMAIELQKLGSQMNFGTNRDALTLTISCLKKNLDATLKLAEEKLFNPLFTEQSFDRLKRQRMETFKVAKSQPSSIASIVWSKLNYGSDNILGISEVGTEATIANLKLDDVKLAYEQRLTSKGARVVVVGAVNEAEVMPKLAFLVMLPSRPVVQPPVPAPPAVEKTRVYLIDAPRSAQTEFRVGYVLPLTFDATGTYFRSTLANFALGGDFNSRLNLNLREDKGWTYGARSGFSADKYSGDFTFSSGIRADATDSALVEVMKEINNYAANGITDAELAFLKSARGQRDALNYESNGQKANFIGRMLQYNLPANYIQQQNDIMNGMKKEDISKVAKDLLHPDKMNILLVGDKAKILPGIQKLGYEIVELDVDGNQLKK